MVIKKIVLFTLIAVLSAACNETQIKQSKDFITNEMDKYKKDEQVSLVPTSQELVTAIKQSLTKGSKVAVNTLGAKGGFANNAQYKIPMPSALQKVSNHLRSFGLGSYVDDYEASLNRAAEKAVPVAADVFKDMVSKMSVSDALSLIKGKDNAVTEYFKKTQNDNLKKRFLPIVSKATKEVGVTDLYNKLKQQSSAFGVKLPDANNYVAEHALTAVYSEFANVEKDIRKDPVARTTNMLKKVFSYYQK